MPQQLGNLDQIGDSASVVKMLEPQSQTYQHPERFSSAAYEQANLLYSSSNNIAGHNYQQYQQQQQQQQDYGEQHGVQIISNNYLQQQQQQQLQNHTFEPQHENHHGHSQDHTQLQQHLSHQHRTHQHAQQHQHHQQPFPSWAYHSYPNHSTYHQGHHAHLNHNHHHHSHGHHLQVAQQADANQPAACEETASEPHLQVDNYQESTSLLGGGGGRGGEIELAQRSDASVRLRAANSYPDHHHHHHLHHHNQAQAALASSSLQSNSSQSSNSSASSLLQSASSLDAARTLAPSSGTKSIIKQETTSRQLAVSSSRSSRSGRLGRATRRSSKPNGQQSAGRRSISISNNSAGGANSSNGDVVACSTTTAPIMLGPSNGGDGTNQQLSAYNGDTDFEDTSTFIVVSDPESGRSVHLTNEELINYTARQLNKAVAGFPPATIKEVKLRRRRLKNRGYAQNCRHKRLDHKINLERQNDDLRATNQEQTRLIVELRQEIVALKRQLASLGLKH